jgi:hypothetical protein
MAPLPESESTLRAVIADRQVPWPQALRIVSDVAHRLVELHRHGTAHGAVGLDTVTVGQGGAARLVPPQEVDGADGVSSAAYGRDTAALGELLRAMGERTTGMPDAAWDLAARTVDGRVVTPAAFAAELDRLVPRGGTEHHRVLRHHPQAFAEASIDELFGGMGAERDEREQPAAGAHRAEFEAGADRPASGLPPELDPRRPARSTRQGAGRRAAVAVVATLAVLAALVVAVVILPRGGGGADDSSPTPTGSSTGSTGQPSGSGTAAKSPATTPVRVLGASAYDPAGDGNENDAGTRLATDGDPTTAWTTDRYATPNLGGLKPGVGLVVRLGRSVTPREVRIVFGVAGSSARLYVGSSRGSLLDSPPIATVRGAKSTATLRTTTARAGRLLLIWITKLPPASSGGGYRGTIAGVTVRAPAG